MYSIFHSDILFFSSWLEAEVLGFFYVGGNTSVKLNLKARVLEEAMLSHLQSCEEKHCKSVLNS